jgi:hypothetical protein
MISLDAMRVPEQSSTDAFPAPWICAGFSLYCQDVSLSEQQASMPTRDDVRGWSAQQRATVARLLAESIDQSPPTMRSPGRRKLVLAVGGVGALFLLPWLAFLSATLPSTSSGGAWRTVWVGFDVALVAAFVATVLTIWLRRQVAVIALVITSTLVTCDVWFDVCLSWGTAEHWGSIAAALVELPVAILLATSAALLMRRSFTVIAQLRGQDPTPGPLWKQPMIHFAPTPLEQGDESAGQTR